MRKAVSLILLCSWFSILAQQKPIIFHNYGIITIGDNSNLLDDIDWEVKISTHDTSFIMKQNSSVNNRFIYFDINIYKPFLLNKTVNISVKENSKLTIEKEYTYPENEDVGYPLIPQEITKKPKELRGHIIDSYSVKTSRETYQLIRTKYTNNYDCWYVLKNNEIVSIHTEKQNLKQKDQRIIVSDINQDLIPEFNFFLTKGQQEKIIHIANTEKFIGYKKENQVNFSANAKKYENLVILGFLHYTLR